MNKKQLFLRSFYILFFTCFLLLTLFSSSLHVSTNRIEKEVVQGESPSTETITVRNRGDEEISYSLNTRSNWIRIQPGRGSLRRNQNNRHRIQFSTRNLRPGDHTATIEIQSPSLSRSVEIKVSVTILEEITLEVSPSSIEHTIRRGEKISHQRLTITSSGRQSTSYRINTSTAWLTISPSSGNIQQSRRQSHRLQINTSQLRAGDHTGRITIRAPGADNSPISIPVRIKVDDTPPFEVSPQQISHRIRKYQGLPDETITIHNKDNQALSYRVQTDSRWLNATPHRERILANRSEEVKIEYDLSNVQPGTRRGTITVETRDTPRQRVEIPVRISVIHEELIRIEPEELHRSARGDKNRGRTTITIHNNSFERLNFRVPRSSSWLSITPQSGQLLPNRSRDLEVQVFLSSLSFGKNHGYFEIEIDQHHQDYIRIPVVIHRHRPPS